ncbi:MAG TPA: hypothetical protein VG432_03120 [Gemmatimonadaceae bacterium]|nr:hypothetical protein [Gemmatimonadaceae bacterium]
MTPVRAARMLLAALACGTWGSTTACTPVVAGSGQGVAPGGSAVREAVVRVGPFATVSAIAVAPARTFVVAEGGLAIYDRNRRGWLPPLALGAAAPRSPLSAERCAAITNLIGDAVWIACGSRVTVVRPAIGAVWATDVGEQVNMLAIDRSGADAFASGRSVIVVSASGTARPLAPGEVIPPERIGGRAVAGGDAALLQAVSDPLLLRDDALHAWRPTAVARGEGASETWVGTGGGGVFLADIDFHRSRQLPFGLRAGMVRWVARTATGVMIVEDPAPWSADRSLVTTASDDLATWEWPSLYTSLGALSAVAAREGTICAAGELGAGLASVAPLAASPTAVLANDHRLFEPANAALAARDGCIVGTDRGPVLLPWPGSETEGAGQRPLGSTPPVRALASSGDTVWIGTIAGLYRAVGGANAVPVRLPASISPNIVALALTENGLALAGGGELWLGSGEGRSATFTRPTASTARLGRLAALASDERTLWVGGSNGALAIVVASGQAMPVPLDEPGAMAAPPLGGREVRSIALAPGVAWLGTAAGVVRVRRGADGLPQ